MAMGWLPIHLGAIGSEGLTVVSPRLHSVVIPATLTILFLLFFVQNLVPKVSASCLDLWWCYGFVDCWHWVSYFRQCRNLANHQSILCLSVCDDQSDTRLYHFGAVYCLCDRRWSLVCRYGDFGKTHSYRLVFHCHALLLNYFGRQAHFYWQSRWQIQFLIPDGVSRWWWWQLWRQWFASKRISEGRLYHQTSGATGFYRVCVLCIPMPMGQIYIPAINWGLFIAICVCSGDV